MKRRRSVRRVSSLFLLPSLWGTAILFFLPFVVVIAYSALSSSIGGRFVGLENYRALLQNHAFLLAAKNTALLCGTAVPLSVVLSLLLALLLSPRMPCRTGLRAVLLSPLFVPVASVVMIFRILFHQNGALNHLLLWLGADPVDFLQSGWSRVAILLLYLWKNLGYHMILFMAALAAVPRDVLEMARLEGAGEVRQFFSIRLYYLSPTILFVTILSLLGAMKLFREVYLLAGAYPYEDLYLLQHFMNNTFQSLDYPKLCSAAILLALGMVLLIGLLFLLESRLGKDLENT